MGNARDWKYARATSSPGRFFLALEFDAREARCRRYRKQPPGYTVTLDVSMKARPRGYIEIKLYKVAEAHLTITTKNSSHKCCAAALCNNRSGNRKDLTFHVFSKDPYRRIVSPLSTFQRTFIYYSITAPGISFKVNFLICKSQIVLVFAALFTLFLEVCGKPGGLKGGFPLSGSFYVRTRAKVTCVNNLEIEAMYERP